MEIIRYKNGKKEFIRNNKLFRKGIKKKKDILKYSLLSRFISFIKNIFK